MRKLISHARHASRHKPFHVAFLGVMFVASLLFFAVVGRAVYSYAAGTPPENSSRPTISGVAAVGQQLNGDNGIWNTIADFTYQWRSCDTNGNNCSDISGANSINYTLQGSDTGHTVKLVVTATTVDGSTAATSDPSIVVQGQLGDFNSDGIINLFDLGVMLGQWGSGSSPIQDLDNNGQVGQSDLSILLGMYQP